VDCADQFLLSEIESLFSDVDGALLGDEVGEISDHQPFQCSAVDSAGCSAKSGG
jgi:hypothetical protein